MGIQKTKKKTINLRCRQAHARSHDRRARARVTRRGPVMITFVSLSKESGSQEENDKFGRYCGELQQKARVSMGNDFEG